MYYTHFLSYFCEFSTVAIFLYQMLIQTAGRGRICIIQRPTGQLRIIVPEARCVGVSFLFVLFFKENARHELVYQQHFCVALPCQWCD